MENQNIIITSLHSWSEEKPSGAQNIAMEFSKNNKVMYVNPPMDRIRKFRDSSSEFISQRNRIRNGEEEPVKKRKENLWVLTPPSIIESIHQVNADSIFDSLNRINNRRFARDIDEGANSICFREYVLFCDSDIVNSFFIAEYLHPKLTLYYTHDEPEVKKLWKNQGYRLEPALMRSCDVVICCTREASELAKQYNASSYFVGNGGDFSLVPSSSNSKDRSENLNLQKGVTQIQKLINEMV